MFNQTANTTAVSNHGVSVFGFILIPLTLLAAIGIAIVVVNFLKFISATIEAYLYIALLIYFNVFF